MLTSPNNWKKSRGFTSLKKILKETYKKPRIKTSREALEEEKPILFIHFNILLQKANKKALYKTSF